MIVHARLCESKVVMPLIVKHHYLHRKVSARYAFALEQESRVVGAVTFSVPASRHMQMSVCPSDPSLVLELSRLWLCDCLPRNTASQFVWSALKQLPPLLIASYADTSVGHLGTVYRAMNFYYAGWTDQDRKTPRYDYVPANGKHTRDAFRSNDYTRVRRKPKIKYWVATGNRRDRKTLKSRCGWPSRPWDGGPNTFSKAKGETP